MAVDKNLFMHDLAIVAIMKDEAPYVKEWLDYHILAGVDHFYIYDNDSSDNMKEILQPYIDAGIVTYTFYPGKCKQMEAYNDAVNRYKFFCRYMAWIDADEFILPKSNRSIADVVDEILSDKPNAGGLVVNLFQFGSNGQKKADYSKGVLERFTRRAKVGWKPPKNFLQASIRGDHIKTIANPRKVKVFINPHFAVYYEGCQGVNENGGIVPLYLNDPPTVEKMVIHHYHAKSFEEYEKKVQRGNADLFNSTYDIKKFEIEDRNDVFDDSILKYRDERPKIKVKPVNYQMIYTTLLRNLSPTFAKNVSRELYKGKMETFLICRKLSEHLRENVLSENAANFFEEASLNAVYRTFFTNINIPDLKCLLSEMQIILNLKYPVVPKICQACINIIPKVLDTFRLNNTWREFRELEDTLNMLKIFDSYEHK